MGTRSRTPRPRISRPSGQHLLRSEAIASELVAQVGIDHDDTVLEIGAGTGRLTRVLAQRAKLVLAVEIDPQFVLTLRRYFGSHPGVRVVEGDILSSRPPTEPFRAFGNLPFGFGAEILRWLLDDPSSSLTRADLLLQYEVARKLAAVWPSTLASWGWLPWWEFALTRHVGRWSFEPPPRVDAGLLSIVRRDPPLLPKERRPAFVRLLRRAFARSSRPVRGVLAGLVSDRAWRRWARERGLPSSAQARDLDVFDWLSIFELLEHRE